MILPVSDNLAPTQKADLLGFVFVKTLPFFSLSVLVSSSREHSCTVISHTDSAENMLDFCICDYTSIQPQETLKNCFACRHTDVAAVSQLQDRKQLLRS